LLFCVEVFIVSVGTPEPGYKLFLCQVTVILGVYSTHQYFEAGVRYSQVKPDESSLEIVDCDHFAIISVDHLKALLDSLVVPLEIGSNALEHSALPFFGVQRFYKNGYS
jgi:hypothetical protein